MKASSSVRTLSVLATAALVLASMVAGTAEAKKKRRPKPVPPAPVGCPVFTPVEPASESAEKAEALDAPVAKVTDAATADAPLTIEYEHPQATPDAPESQFFNIQVETAAEEAGLYIRQEWAVTPVSDMDLYLYDGATGDEVAYSGAANAVPLPVGPLPELGSTGQETGAWGYESINGHSALDCAGFTVESRAFLTPGETMTLTIWLGEPVLAQ